MSRDHFRRSPNIFEIYTPLGRFTLVKSRSYATLAASLSPRPAVLLTTSAFTRARNGTNVKYAANQSPI